MIPSRSRTVAFAASTLLWLAACQAGPADPATEVEVALAAGLAGDAIRFRAEGEPLDAPPLAPGEQLGLRAAVERCLSCDPSLQSALARVRVAIADAEQARRWPNPVLDVAFRFGSSGPPVIDAGLVANVVQMLLQPRHTAAADHRLLQASADALTAALDLLADVQTAFAAAQASDALVPLLEGRLELLQRLLELARLRAAAGEGAQSDVITLDAQRIGVEVDVADARRERTGSRLHLARLLGEPSAAAAWPLEPWSPPPATTPAADVCIAQALAHRPEVQSANWQLAALADDAAAVGLEPWADTQLGVVAERDGRWTVGPSLEVPVPLFDGGCARAHRVAALQAAARHDLAAARRKVVEDVRLALADLAGNLANLERVQRELVPRQQQRRDQAEFVYRRGDTDLTPLLLAESELRAAQVRAIELQRQTTQAFVRLQRAMGGRSAAEEHR